MSMTDIVSGWRVVFRVPWVSTLTRGAFRENTGMSTYPCHPTQNRRPLRNPTVKRLTAFGGSLGRATRRIRHVLRVVHAGIPALACLFVTAILSGCGGGTPGKSQPDLVFGQTGLGPGDFSYPRAVAVGPDGCVFVIDKTARVQRFNPKGRFELDWRMPQWEAGKPTGVTVDSRGRLLIADTHYHRVMIYDRDGKLLDQFGSRGSGPGQFEFPTGIAVDRDGFIYVGEYGGNDRINKFTPDYKFVMAFGGADAGEGSLLRPESLDFDAEQTLWVADACHHRLCRFSRDGKLLSTLGREGSAPGELRYPYCVRVCRDGNLLVTEFGNNRVQMLTPAGRSLWTWGKPGREPGQLAYPWAAAISSDGRVYVVDSGNNRIQMFHL
jgi:DNA-binding beta-propeller fold protein YncE